MNFIWRALFPSWKFFDQFQWILDLQVKTNPQDQNSEWHSCLKPPTRSWRSIFYNPEGNLYHACNSAIERYIQDPENKVSAEIIENMTRYLLKHHFGAQPGLPFQFRIRAATSGDEFSDVLISKVLEV